MSVVNHIDIRQIPAKSSRVSEDIVGSWFPSGYYGHFRGKTRMDLCNYFRQLAQPQPPTVFSERQKSQATSHKFSQHDNRFKFENDPLVRGTQAGFGRRRAGKDVRGKFDPFFIGWLPENADKQKYVDETKTTSYAKDYNGKYKSSKILSEIPKSHSLPSSQLSFYSTVHNHGQPDEEQSKQIRQETFQRYADTQTRRVQLQTNEKNVNVASCLVWDDPDREKQLKKNSKLKKLKLRNSFHDMPIRDQEQTEEKESLPRMKPLQLPPLRTCKSQEDVNAIGVITTRMDSPSEETYKNSVESLIEKYM